MIYTFTCLGIGFIYTLDGFCFLGFVSYVYMVM